MDWGFVKVFLFKKKKNDQQFPLLSLHGCSPGCRHRAPEPEAVLQAQGWVWGRESPLGVSWEENPRRVEWCAGSCLLGSVGVGRV